MPMTPKQRAALSIAGNGLFLLIVGGGVLWIAVGAAAAAPALAIIALLAVIAFLIWRRTSRQPR